MSSSKTPENILELSDITVKYGSHYGLRNCSFTARRGEFHVIAGNRGAGKSSLVGVLSGRITPVSGKLIIKGEKISKFSPITAMRSGITTIHSSVRLYQHMSAVENLFLNREIRKMGMLKNNKKMEAIAENALRQMDCKIDPNLPVRFYDTSIQQKIYLSTILCFDSEIIVIDEITDRLKHEELENIFHLLSMLRRNGSTVLYVSSDVEEIQKFANRVTFLQNGRVMNTEELSEIDELKLVELTYSSMVNRSKLEKSNIELFYLHNLNRNILKNLPVPLIVLNSEGKAVFSNVQAIDPDRWLEQAFILNSEQNKNLRTSITEKTPIIIREAKISGDPTRGQKIDLHINPFYDSEKSFIGTMLMWFPTADKENPFRILLERFGTSVNELNTIISIEHEINNPLEIISNYLHIISTGEGSDDIKEKIKIMQNEISRIKRILKKTGAEATAENPNHEYRLNVFLNEILTFVKSSIDVNKIRFILDIGNEVTLDVDQDSLKQILINIILNGIEAIKEEGDIEIGYRKSTRKEKNYSVLTISDSGTGIPKDEIDLIFKPFYSTKRADGERGLGLSISQDIARKMGGYIEVESISGSGSTFSIYLPKEKPSG